MRVLNLVFNSQSLIRLCIFIKKGNKLRKIDSFLIVFLMGSMITNIGCDLGYSYEPYESVTEEYVEPVPAPIVYLSDTRFDGKFSYNESKVTYDSSNSHGETLHIEKFRKGYIDFDGTDSAYCNYNSYTRYYGSAGSGMYYTNRGSSGYKRHTPENVQFEVQDGKYRSHAALLGFYPSSCTWHDYEFNEDGTELILHDFYDFGSNQVLVKGDWL
jgi:hypothetical protein